MVSPLPTLVTKAEAVAHLKLSEDMLGSNDSPESNDLELKIEIATALVLDYIDRDDDDWTDTMLAWTATTVPRVVKAAILVQLAELWRFRGDDIPDQTPQREHGWLAPMVVAYLHRYRQPAVS